MLVDAEVHARLHSGLGDRLLASVVVAVLTSNGFNSFAAVLRKALQLHNKVIVGLGLRPSFLQQTPSLLQAESLTLDQICENNRT